MRFSRWEWGILALLCIVQFAHIVDFMIMMPLGPQLMRLLNINTSEFSLLVSAYTFCAGATSLASAFFLDRFDRKKGLIFFFTGFGIGTLACGLSPNYSTLLVARALTGAFGGVLNSLVFSIIGDVFPAEKRGSATGLVMGAFSLASIFGVPFSLYLANLGSWHTPLLVLGGLTLPVLGLMVAVVPSLKGHMDQNNKASAWSFIRTVPFLKRPRLALILIITLVLGQFAIIPFLSPSLVANAGLREDQLPLMYLLGGIAALIGSPFFGRMCDRIGPVRVMLWAAPFSIIPFILITNLGRTPIPWVFAATSFFFFIMGGRMVPAMTILNGSVLPRNRGAFMSLMSSVQQFAAALAAILAGSVVIADTEGHLMNYPILGYFAAGLTLVALAIAYTLRREPTQVV